MDDQVRTNFHDALARSDNAATRALADVVVGQVDGQLACWGDLVDYVHRHFEKDEDSLALWRVLTAVGDRRPQLLWVRLFSRANNSQQDRSLDPPQSRLRLRQGCRDGGVFVA
jgi:hypothetical protein